MSDPAPAADLGLIWAEAQGGVIGADGTMPWHVPEDLAHFRATTLGSPVIMGRRTWDSLAPRFRPLPGRRNIVITRDPTWQAQGTEVANSLDSAIALVAGPAGLIPTAWVIGGGEIYRQAINSASRLEVTEINARFDGDAYAPEITSGWTAVSVEPPTGWLTSGTGIEYRFVRYVRA